MTKSERLKIYESFFHRINLQVLTMNNEKIKEAVTLIDRWSYAHRQGNGEVSEYQQKKMVESVVKKMKEF